jgi:MscS family membrane protein
MRKLSSDPSTFFREWLLSIGILIITLLITQGARALLGRVKFRGQLAFFHELAPSLASLLYVIGFQVFLDTAPLEARVAMWLQSANYVFAIILIMALIRRAAMSLVEWGAVRTMNSPALQHGFIPLLRNVITLFVFLSGAIMVLRYFHYDVLSLLTALGVGSLAVGLAAKETLANMISGFTLIIDRNLKPGDRINLGGQVGDVEEIGLRSTRLRIGDGNTLIVPNAELVNTKILNLSIPNREVSCSTMIRVPFGIPFSRIKAICLTLLDQMEKVNRGRGRSVNLASLADGNQLIAVSFWVTDLEHSGAAVSDFNERLLQRLTEHNISLTPSTPAQVSQPIA